MEKVLSWFVENYELVILIAACILDLVLFLFGVFKKKVDPSVSNVITRIPEFIVLAENKFGAGHGIEKKNFVLKMACDFYEYMTDVQVHLRSRIYKAFEMAIEQVLETPTKKGK